MKKIIIIVLMILLSLSVVNAGEKDLGVFKQNDCMNLIQICDSCSYVNFTTILNPNSTLDNYNVEMTKNNNVYSFNFCNTSTVGNYIASGVGDPNSVYTSWNYNFVITKSGDLLVSGNLLVLLWILFIFSISGLVLTFFYTILKFVTFEETVYDVLITSFFFVLLLMAHYMAKSTIDPFILDVTEFFVTWSGWTNVFLPILALTITILVKNLRLKKSKGATPESIMGIRRF